MKSSMLMLVFFYVVRSAWAAPDAHEKRMWRVVLDSNVLLHQWLPDQSWERSSKAKVSTLRHFNSMSHHRLRHTLHATLVSLPDGSVAKESVGYVAAMYGFDVARNAQRVTERNQNGENRFAGRFGAHKDVNGMAEGIYEHVSHIYYRHRNPKVRDQLLTLDSDGAGTTVLIGIRLGLLHKEPHAVLHRIAVLPRALNLMRYTLSSDGRASEKQILQRFRRSRYPEIRRAAWLCLRTLSDAEQRRKPQEVEM